jgi:hypothetical protein
MNFDLSKAKDCEKLNSLDDWKQIQKVSNLEIAMTGKSPVMFKDKPIFFCETEWFIIDGIKIHYLDLNRNLHANRAMTHKEICYYGKLLDGVVIPDGILIDGDIDGNGNDNCLAYTYNEKFPTVSFSCIETLLSINTNGVLNKFTNGSLRVVDFTLDKTKKLSNKDREALTKWKKDPTKHKNPTPLGFALVGKKWHQAATVLLFDKSANKSYLFGQDEGTYFGCELKDNPKTIKNALISLIPSEVKMAKSWQRQGEWFIVPVKEKNVPSLNKCHTSDYIILPKEVPSSSDHAVVPSDYDIRLAPNGKIYVKDGAMQHSERQHVDVNWKKWATFYKNTAVRSVSVEGVD